MTKYDSIKQAFLERGVLSLHDECCRGVPRVYFSRLVREGVISRIGNGVYSCATYSFSEHIGYVEAQRVVPDGVFCLFSALKFHNLTLENPHRLHMAVSRGTYVPRNELPVDFYRYSESAFEYGIEEHQTKDGRVRVYSVGKTLADCFKFRNVVGLDVFIAAVRDAREKNSIDYNTLWTAINVCRVAKAIRPYLEGML